MSESEKPIILTLSPELSNRVRDKMHSFGYADPIDVIEQGIAALEAQNDDFEQWLRDEVIPACEEYDRDPSTARTPEQVRATLAAEYERALKAG